MQAHSSILIMSEERDQPTIFSDTACGKGSNTDQAYGKPAEHAERRQSSVYKDAHGP